MNFHDFSACRDSVLPIKIMVCYSQTLPIRQNDQNKLDGSSCSNLSMNILAEISEIKYWRGALYHVRNNCTYTVHSAGISIVQ